MEYRFLGRSGLRVSAISLGGWITYSGQVDQETTAECMHAAYMSGINFFDTAEEYGNGRSEIAMGAAIKKHNWNRSSLVISTKIYWGGDGPNDKGLSRKHIIEGIRASLKRLQLDYVDLIFAHRPDELTPMEEIVRAFNWVIDQGYAFYWGTSEWSAEQLTDAHRVAEKLNLIGPLMEQPQYNMFNRERFEKEYSPMYEKHGLGTTVWSPLACGILTGKYNDLIVPEDSRFAFKDDEDIQNLANETLYTESGLAQIAKVKALNPIAERLECTLAQLALAWCLKNPNVSTVITGASKPSQIIENVKAIQVIPKLTQDVMAEIDGILMNKPSLNVKRC